MLKRKKEKQGKGVDCMSVQGIDNACIPQSKAKCCNCILLHMISVIFFYHKYDFWVTQRGPRQEVRGRSVRSYSFSLCPC